MKLFLSEAAAMLGKTERQVRYRYLIKSGRLRAGRQSGRCQENGARLGLLIDPEERRVQVYREGGGLEILVEPASVSAEPVLTGFRLSLEGIWSLPW